VTDHPTPAGQPTVPIDTLSGLFLVLFAKALGYFVLGLCAFILLRRQPWSFSAADAVFWVCAAAIPYARQQAANKYEGVAAPEARIQLRKRMLVHLGAAAVIWVAAHSVRLFG